MRLIVVFEKGKGVSYISHLELMRTFHRVLRRTNLPIVFSKGFSPHVKLAFSPPLSVGIVGENELMDLKLTETVNNNEVVEKLNMLLPDEIIVKKCKEIQENTKSFMALTEASEYSVFLNEIGFNDWEAHLTNFLNLSQILIKKENKKESIDFDIKPLILSAKYIKTPMPHIICRLSASSNKSLHIKTFLTELFKHANIDENIIFVDIIRNELLTYNDINELVPIYDTL